MSFKENLLKKMKIDCMSKKVLSSFGSPESGLKMDKETMRGILELSPYKPKRERDLELYVQESHDGPDKILVLDNELPIYKTTVEDVALRKSPTIKEMVNIRNIIKIVNDTDVKISRKEKSLQTIQQECIDLIDLSFKKSDLDEIENDGAVSLERGYTEGVLESISLFAELLGYTAAPKVFRVSHCKLFGELKKKETAEILFGPAVIYNLMHNSLKWIDEPMSSLKEFEIKYLHSIAVGKEKAAKEGISVLDHLKQEIIKRYL